MFWSLLIGYFDFCYAKMSLIRAQNIVIIIYVHKDKICCFFTDSPYHISYMFAVVCFLLKCIRFYTANWNCIENKYAKYGGSYLKLPRYGEKSYFIEDSLLCH